MARGTELEAPSFFCDLAEERPEENPFPYPKKYPPPKKKKEYCKGFFWRAYRRNGVEAEGGAYRVTTQSERTS